MHSKFFFHGHGTCLRGPTCLPDLGELLPYETEVELILSKVTSIPPAMCRGVPRSTQGTHAAGPGLQKAALQPPEPHTHIHPPPYSCPHPSCGGNRGRKEERKAREEGLLNVSFMPDPVTCFLFLNTLQDPMGMLVTDEETETQDGKLDNKL